MAWPGTLHIQYQRRGDRTTAHDRHDGPLRVLQALYPEGPSVCHHVLVHPPGGLVGGDDLSMQIDVGSAAHALITTPGATRFYRSTGDMASQRITATLQSGARLEWLPLETIAHDHARGRNHVRFTLEPGAQLMGWDMLALGLPASNEVFAHGRFEQQLEWSGVWLERGVLELDEPRHAEAARRLLASPLGWRGHSVLATMWLASGSPLSSQQLIQLVDVSRTVLPASASFTTAIEHAEAWPATISAPAQTIHGINASHTPAVCGLSAPNDRLLVMRVLAHRTEQAWPILRAVRDIWRSEVWQLPSYTPRVWST